MDLYIRYLLILLKHDKIMLLGIIVFSLLVSTGCSSDNEGKLQNPEVENPETNDPETNDPEVDDPVTNDPDANNISITSDLTSCDKPFNYRFEATIPLSLTERSLQYEWDFGDGGVGVNAISSHQFITTGDYNVKFKIRDAQNIISVTSVVHSVQGCTISGSIQPQKGSEADSDVNDATAPFQSNDQVETAQAIRNPVVVGGFASAVGTGVQEDRFSLVGDTRDVYQVRLAKNQIINLNVRDFSETNPAANDLDLFLIDTADLDNPVASSVDSVATESIVVPESGNYIIVVAAVNGISNYVLAVGQTGVNNNATSVGLRLENEIVADEILVKFKDSVEKSGSFASLQSGITEIGLKAVAGNANETMLFQLNDGLLRNKTFLSLGVKQDEKSLPSSVSLSESLRAKYETLKVIKKLRARADVISADPNYIRRPLQVPNDTHYTKQWHYPLINLPQAWDVTTGTSAIDDVIVAVIDTGVMLNHPDLANKLVAGFDFIRNNDSSNDNEAGIDNNPDDPGDGATPGTSSFHGTHVAGTVGAETNNNSGVSGVSWGAKIMPVRVLGKSGGTSFDVLQGVLYAAGLSNISNTTPTQKADIINLSLGGGGFSQTEQNTFTEVRNAGVIVVAAAGNESSNTASYPASYNGVISVSAVDSQKQLAPYSNFGRTIDIAAPGGDSSRDANSDGFVDGVLSTAGDDASGTPAPIFRFYQGTSMASPHMAGVVALMKALYSDLTPEILDELIVAGSITEDLENDGQTVRNNSFGYGLIDAFKAVQIANELANGNELPGSLSITPDFLNFENFLTEITIATSNSGGQPVSIVNVSDDVPWLQVTPATVDINNIGTYKASVSRNGLGDGIYTANVTFITDVGDTINIPVTMIVGSIGEGIDQLGQLWVILIDAATDRTIKAIQVNINNNNQYQYAFNELESGDYVIVAGTDADNDGFICDAGEACGAYPTFNSRIDVNLSTNSISSLNFLAGFNLTFDVNTTSTFKDKKFYKYELPSSKLLIE